MKPTIPQVIDRFRAYHQQHGAWGSLHIVLSDGNHEDSSVTFCAEFAREKGDIAGEDLARILLTMSRTQRGRIANLCVPALRSR